MKLDIVQARQFNVLLEFYLAQPIGEDVVRASTELGIPWVDFDPLLHWPRVCARRALKALRVVESEIARTNWESERDPR